MHITAFEVHEKGTTITSFLISPQPGLFLKSRAVRLAAGAVAVFALALLHAPAAHGQSSYYTTYCAPCHSSATTASTCAGCHAHGTHSSSSKSDVNLKATTDKTNYAPGETVSVTITGGYRSGWVRAILYDQNGTEVKRSTGPTGMGGGTSFPIVLTALASAAAGTYTSKAAWYGNEYDLGDRGGTTFFGPNWMPEPNNPNHGREIVSTNSFTVTAAAPVLSSLSISGPATVNEGSSASYTATATWSDGSTSNVAASAAWSENSSFATISSGRVLTPSAVTSNQPVIVSASYTFGGVTKTASVTVTIVDSAPAPPPKAIAVMPGDNATDVCVNTVITVSTTGVADIRTAVNRDTFSLRQEGAATTAKDEEDTCVVGEVVQGTLTYNGAGATAVFTPKCRLSHGTSYTATIGVGDGSPLSAPYSWRFVTIAKAGDADRDGVPDNEDDNPLDDAQATLPTRPGQESSMWTHRTRSALSCPAWQRSATQATP